MAKVTRSSSVSLSAQPSWFEKMPELRKDLICIGLLYLIILVLCNKIAFNDMIFANSNDTYAHESFMRAVEHLQTTENADPLWIPYIFSGMPVFGTMIFLREANYLQLVIGWISKALFFGSELSWMLMHFFLAGAFMYALARVLKFSQIPSLFAALTLMLNPYAIELAEAGHGSKLVTLSYVPLMLLLTVWLLQRRDLLSLGLLAIASATMLQAGHVQIAFYGFMLIGLYVLYETVVTIKEQPAGAAKNIGLFAIAIMLGFVISAYKYLPTQEYARYSIRGGGEGSVLAGLDFDYATNWSFHPLETLNYLIPTTFGMSSQYLTDWQGGQTELPLYWGWMPFTTSTVYVGILPIVLAALALIYRRTRFSLFLAGFAGLSLLIAYGKFSPFVYDLLFNYLPFFNKFRVPVMILHLMPIIIGLLAAYGLSFLLDLPALQKQVNIAKLTKRLTITAGVIAGMLILGTIGRSGLQSFLSDFMFHKTGELQQYTQQYGAQNAQQIVNAFVEKRFDVFWSGFLKFAIFACAGMGAVILYLRGTLQRFSMALICIAILAVDLMILDSHYINPKPKTSLQDQFTPDAAITQLKAEADTSLFRVYPVERFEDNIMTAHQIQSIGGYSPAKLKIYQEMRDSCNLDKGNLNVVSMLNVKYFYRNQRTEQGWGEGILQPNPNFLPRAWFVDEARVVGTKREIFNEMNKSTFDPRTVAYLEKQPAGTLGKPGASSVRVTSYSSMNIELQATTDQPSLLVLSEMYYPAGWTATIDGAETEIYKTNYILRGVIVPPGTHTVTFRFKPESYDLGFTVSYAGWGLSLLMLAAGAFPLLRGRMGGAKGSQKTEEVKQTA